MQTELTDEALLNPNMPLKHNLTYESDLCLKLDGRCFDNAYLLLLDKYFPGLNDVVDFYIEYVQEQDAIKKFGLGFKKNAICHALEKDLAVTYPIGSLGRLPLNFALVVGEAGTMQSTNSTLYQLLDELCGPDLDVGPYLIDARYLRLSYHVKHLDGWLPLSTAWQRQLQQLSVAQGTVADKLKDKCGQQVYEVFDFALNQIFTFTDGLDRLNEKFTPFFVLAFVVLTAFTQLCSIVLLKTDIGGCNRGYVIDWCRSKPVPALAGVVTVALGTGTGFGLLLAAGQWWNPVALATPFLIISIGVDDMFIIVNSWHRTPSSLAPGDRFASAVSESAVSITITSITDFLSFTIGCTVQFPIVRMLSSFAAAGVFFIYLYHLTFFLGVMAWAAQLEHDRKHCVLFWRKVDNSACCLNANKKSKVAKTDDTPMTVISQQNGSEIHPSKTDTALPGHIHEESLPAKFIRLYYGPALLSAAGQIFTVIIFVAYISGATYGIMQLKQGLEPSSLMLPDDPFIKHSKWMEDSFWQSGMMLTIVVNNAPNLADPAQAEYLGQFISSFTSSDFALRTPSTNQSIIYWYNNFEKYWLPDANLPKNVSARQFYDELQAWLKTDDAQSHWMMDLVLQDVNATMSERYVGFPEYYNPAVEAETVSLMAMKTVNSSQQLFDWLFEYYCINASERLLQSDLPPRSNYNIQCERMLAAVTPTSVNMVLESWARFWREARSYPIVTSFRLYLVMTHFNSTEAHKNIMQKARALAALYPSLNGTTYNEYYIFADQYLAVLPTTLTNMAIALAAMLTVALIMIPDLLSAMLCVLAIVSIDFGLLGYMALWGVRLDGISMISILMSVGFAVDLTAHICYAYVVARAHGEQREDVHGHMVQALSHLGWPMCQGAVSTIVGMLVLTGITAYSIQTFYRTIILICTFGLLHSLLFLPVPLFWAQLLKTRLCNTSDTEVK